MAESRESSPSLSQVWQLPVLALGLMTFGVGLWLASAPGEEAAGEGSGLDRLAGQVDAGRYEQALETADELAERWEQVPEELHGQYYLLKGDALSRRDDAQDHQQVVEAYRQARQEKAELSEAQLERMAESLAALGQLDEALAILRELGEDGADQRQQLLRRPIERGLAQSMDDLDADAVERSIDRLLAAEHLTTENEVWATAKQAELLMRTGQAERAIDMLLRRLARLQDAEEASVGRLKLRLGQAYLEEGDLANAERWVLRAQEDLGSAAALNAEAAVALGRIRYEQDNPAEAVEFFTEAVQRYADTPAYREALLGKAESEARLSRHDRALADYEAAVDLMQQEGRETDGLGRRLAESLQNQHDLRFSQEEYAVALDYLEQAQRLHAEPSAELLLSLAVTNERLAEQLAQEATAAADEADGDDEDAPEPVDPVVERRILEHQAAAADGYLAHAEEVVGSDDDAYGDSLWAAGRLYDEAGLHQRAIAVFDQYIEQRPEDPRQLQATFRLAQAYQADGRPDDAIPLYTRLIEDNPNAPEGYRSLVPLARSYLSKGAEFTDRAEQVLLSVVTDHESLQPESDEFREALIELGQLYYRRGGEGDYEKAIARLSEVVERYGRDEPMPELLFQLGDAYRKSVDQIDEKLARALPPSREAELAEERATRLHEAREQFDRVILAYEDRDPRSLNELQELYLRNSYFYRADCAYGLEQYEGPEGSIALYEKAVQRYDKDPAALVGLVQIVNSYAELGEWDKARTANERAKVYLDAIPDQAFEDPNLPMDRDHWQRWLDWSSELALNNQAARAE